MTVVRGTIAAALVGVFLAGLAAASSAEEARVLRIGVPGALHSILYYHDSLPATQLLTHAVFDTLIAYDERRRRYAPLLATSWRRIDDRTLEFELHDDVRWHDGVALDADDVVYTLNWLGDAETKLYMQHRWGWIDHAEKLGRHKLRLIAKRPTPSDLARLATAIAILPEHKHGLLLAERPYFGRTPIGSGPYRGAVVGNEIVLQRVEGYRHGGAAKQPGNVARATVQGVPPDTLISNFDSGAFDLVLDVPPDAAKRFARTRGTQLAIVEGFGALVLAFDARRRAGNRAVDRALNDPRVRLALDTAIDRSALVALAPGARVPDGLCWPEQAGCGAAAPASVYDPAAARALLAAAGAAGLELTIAAQGPFAASAAEIIARQWRIVGITTRVDQVSPYELYSRQREHELQVAVTAWHAGEMPDVAETVATFMAPGFWDLHGDAALHALAQASDAVMHDQTRREIVRQALARADDHAYFSVIGPNPTFVLHRADVGVDSDGRFGSLGMTLLDLRWR